MSVFAKITWLGIAAALMTLAIVIFFAHVIFNELREDAQARRFSEHIASELILDDPSPERIADVARQFGLVIRYRDPDGERSAGNAPRFEDVTPVRRLRGRARRGFPVWQSGINDATMVSSLSGRPYLVRRRGRRIVLVGHSWSAFKSGLWDEAAGPLAGLVFSLAVVWTGFYYLLRRLWTPLGHLRRDMAAVGDGEWREADESRRDEFGRLAAVFNGMQKRLRTLIQSKQRALAAASHELRSPLTRLKLAAEFVPDAKLRERMGGDLRELESLTGGILDQSRMEALPAETRAVDLDELARDEAAGYAGAATVLETDLSSRMVVTADPTRLRRALRAVVDNGLKFARSRVVLSSRKLADGRGELRVADDGSGVGEGDLPHLFEAFYRTDESRARETGGFGLGLALAKTAVESQGGEMAAWNNAEGGGLTVAIRLPERDER